jgi:hypothetical protein
MVVVLTEKFGHEVINFKFEKFFSIVVAKNTVAVFRCPSDVANLRGYQSNCIGRKYVDFLDFSQVRQYRLFCIQLYLLPYLKISN